LINEPPHLNESFLLLTESRKRSLEIWTTQMKFTYSQGIESASSKEIHQLWFDRRQEVGLRSMLHSKNSNLAEEDLAHSTHKAMRLYNHTVGFSEILFDQDSTCLVEAFSKCWDILEPEGMSQSFCEAFGRHLKWKKRVCVNIFLVSSIFC
jgi:hypothetical protein